MPRDKTDSTRTNVYLPNNLIKVGKQLSNSRGVTFSETMRTALREYVIREVQAAKAAQGADRESERE